MTDAEIHDLSEEFQRKLCALMIDYNVQSCVSVLLFANKGRMRAEICAPVLFNVPLIVNVAHAYLKNAAIRSVLEMPGSYHIAETTGTVTVVHKKGGGNG